jgi:hypothetical protein
LKAADRFARADPVIKDGVGCDGWADTLLSAEEGARLTHEWVLKDGAESTLYDRLGRNLAGEAARRTSLSEIAQ